MLFKKANLSRLQHSSLPSIRHLHPEPSKEACVCQIARVSSGGRSVLAKHTSAPLKSRKYTSPWHGRSLWKPADRPLKAKSDSGEGLCWGLAVGESVMGRRWPDEVPWLGKLLSQAWQRDRDHHQGPRGSPAERRLGKVRCVQRAM